MNEPATVATAIVSGCMFLFLLWLVLTVKYGERELQEPKKASKGRHRK